MHNQLGRFARERQYGDALQTLLAESGIKYERERPLTEDLVENSRTNLADFVIDEKILLELKARPLISKEDYVQIQRYLQTGKYQLGLLVNFRNKYLKPIRIIRSHS